MVVREEEAMLCHMFLYCPRNKEKIKSKKIDKIKIKYKGSSIP